MKKLDFINKNKNKNWLLYLNDFKNNQFISLLIDDELEITLTVEQKNKGFMIVYKQDDKNNLDRLKNLIQQLIKEPYIKVNELYITMIQGWYLS